MTRYGKLFLYFIVLSALAWILPWLYGFVTPDTRSAPFTLLSEVNDQAHFAGRGGHVGELGERYLFEGFFSCVGRVSFSYTHFI